MATEALLARTAGHSGQRATQLARALVVSSSTFLIVAGTLCTTAGALFWGGLALLDLPEAASLVGGALAAAAPLPFAAWVAWNAYRHEAGGSFDDIRAPLPGDAGPVA